MSYTYEIIIGSVVVAFLWEHLCKEIKEKGVKRDGKTRPSTIISYAAKKSQWGFSKIGEGFARISSLYTYFYLQEIADTFMKIMKPLLNLVTSPLYSIKGYVSQMEMYDHPYLVLFGTITIVFGVEYVASLYDIFLFGYIGESMSLFYSHITLLRLVELFVLFMGSVFLSIICLFNYLSFYRSPQYKSLQDE